jgi:hypothetical protein
MTDRLRRGVPTPTRMRHRAPACVIASAWSTATRDAVTHCTAYTRTSTRLVGDTHAGTRWARTTGNCHCQWTRATQWCRCCTATSRPQLEALMAASWTDCRDDAATRGCSGQEVAPGVGRCVDRATCKGDATCSSTTRLGTLSVAQIHGSAVARVQAGTRLKYAMETIPRRGRSCRCDEAMHDGRTAWRYRRARCGEGDSRTRPARIPRSTSCLEPRHIDACITTPMHRHRHHHRGQRDALACRLGNPTHRRSSHLIWPSKKGSKTGGVACVVQTARCKEVSG